MKSLDTLSELKNNIKSKKQLYSIRNEHKYSSLTLKAPRVRRVPWVLLAFVLFDRWNMIDEVMLCLSECERRPYYNVMMTTEAEWQNYSERSRW